MAEQGPSLGYKKLEEILTCPVCLGCYDNPKTLSCLHSFCLKCIQRLPVDLDKGKYQIRCPACCQNATLPDNGVTNLPSAFLINSFLEIRELLNKINISEGQQICCGNCEKASATRYCKECATVYCEECLALHNKLKNNTGHHITDVKDVASNVYSMKQEVIMNCTDHNKPLEVFCETCQYLICLSCIIRHHRDHNFDSVADVFPKHRQEITSFLQTIKYKIQTMNGQLTALTKQKKKIVKQGEDTSKEIHQYAQQIIESVQQCEGLLVKQVDASVQHKLKLLGEQVKEAETALKQLKSCEEYIEQSLEVGSPQQILSEKQRMIQGMGAVSKQINPEVFQPVEEADITFTRNKALVDSCKDIGKVKCSFSYPQNKPQKVITGMVEPRCVAANSQGAMVVGGAGTNCITVMDKDSKIVQSFGAAKRGVCYGVAFTIDGEIVASDYNNHKLYKLSLQGEYMASVGGRGSGPMEFNQPNEIAVYPTTGKMYVADGGNHRIQVINNDFTYSHSIGSKGTAPGQLLNPCGVALDSAGNVYTCNTGNATIDVFTSDGVFVRRFGSRGSGDGELRETWSIAVDRHNLVYVADEGNHRISIFTADGQFVKAIKYEGLFDNITFVTIDMLGNLYIGDHLKKILAIF